MRIEIIRLFDNDLRRKVYLFDASMGIGDNGVEVRFSAYREERRLSRRHRNWMHLAGWSRWGHSVYDNTKVRPELPDDVSTEVIDTITQKIIISNP